MICRLVVGTNRGFAIVDVFSNSCLYTFCSVTSILCKTLHVFAQCLNAMYVCTVCDLNYMYNHYMYSMLPYDVCSTPNVYHCFIVLIMCMSKQLTCIIFHTDMANPNKFSRQIRQESQLGLNAVKKATISRHATSLALSVKAKNNHSTTSTPVKRAASAKPLTMKTEKSRSHIPEQVCRDEVDSHTTVSELESCVSALELVQLQLDKQCK